MPGKDLSEREPSKRLQILSSEERSIYYELPEFSLKEREYFFDLSDEELTYITNMKSINSKVLFILQLGYFKAKKRFFAFSTRIPSVKEDIEYIIKCYFPSIRKRRIKIDKNIRLKHRKIIQKIFSYQSSSECGKEIRKKCKDVVAIDINPKFIFKEVFRFVQYYRIILPSYSTIQRIISETILQEERNIYSHLLKLIDDELETALEKLLKKEESSRYMLTIIRTPSNGLSYRDVKAETKKQEIIKPIYISSVKILKEIKISNLTIKYFATLTIKLEIYRISRYEKAKRYLFLLCFVYYRYQKINDDLVKTYFYFLSRYTGKIKHAVNIKILIDRKENTKNLKKAPELLELFIRSGTDNLSFKDIKSIAYSILEKDKLKKLIKYMAKISFNKRKLKWEEWENKYDTVKRNIRPIIRALDFDTNKLSLDKFFYAFEYFQSYIRSKKRRPVYFPQDFIKKRDVQYLYRKVFNKETGKKERQLVFSRYEIYLYKKLSYYLNLGDVFVNDSFEFRSLEDALVNRTYFEKNHEKLVSSLNLNWFTGDFKKKVIEKANIAESSFIKVNQSILNAENPDFKVNKLKNTWSLDYEAVGSDLSNNHIFKHLPLIDLPDLLTFVNHKTSFYNDFTHILKRNINVDKNDELSVIATIIAYGVNMGTYKMSKSSNVSLEKLKTTSANYFRLETLKNACETIINATSKLPIFTHYYISDDIVHSTTDGQKTGLLFDTINSRYSPKYFGLEKGISVLTLNANYQPLSSKIISANEYEGHQILELLLMNTSEIDPDIHSTDSHGITDINFALLELCGYSFAPRYRKLGNRSNLFYTTKPAKAYNKNYILKSSGEIDIDLIVSEEMNIKRIITSIMTKTSSVSTIVKKLFHSPKNNKTRKAFAELDKILKTIYILNYINDLSLRQNVQIALNRGESYHQLKKAVAFVNGGKLKAKSENEQLIYQECSRLICSAIIYFNSYILSSFLLQKKRLGLVNEIKQLKRISPIAWTHINLYGKYNFSINNDVPIISNLYDLIDTIDLRSDEYQS